MAEKLEKMISEQLMELATKSDPSQPKNNESFIDNIVKQQFNLNLKVPMANQLDMSKKSDRNTPKFGESRLDFCNLNDREQKDKSATPVGSSYNPDQFSGSTSKSVDHGYATTSLNVPSTIQNNSVIIKSEAFKNDSAIPEKKKPSFIHPKIRQDSPLFSKFGDQRRSRMPTTAQQTTNTITNITNTQSRIHSNEPKTQFRIESPGISDDDGHLVGAPVPNFRQKKPINKITVTKVAPVNDSSNSIAPGIGGPIVTRTQLNGMIEKKGIEQQNGNKNQNSSQTKLGNEQKELVGSEAASSSQQSFKDPIKNMTFYAKNDGDAKGVESLTSDKEQQSTATDTINILSSFSGNNISQLHNNESGAKGGIANAGVNEIKVNGYGQSQQQTDKVNPKNISKANPTDPQDRISLIQKSVPEDPNNQFKRSRRNSFRIVSSEKQVKKNIERLSKQTNNSKINHSMNTSQLDSSVDGPHIESIQLGKSPNTSISVNQGKLNSMLDSQLSSEMNSQSIGGVFNSNNSKLQGLGESNQQMNRSNSDGEFNSNDQSLLQEDCMLSNKKDNMKGSSTKKAPFSQKVSPRNMYDPPSLLKNLKNAFNQEPKKEQRSLNASPKEKFAGLANLKMKSSLRNGSWISQTKQQDRSLDQVRTNALTQNLNQKKSHRKVESAVNRGQRRTDFSNDSFVDGYSGMPHNNTTVLQPISSKLNKSNVKKAPNSEKSSAKQFSFRSTPLRERNIQDKIKDDFSKLRAGPQIGGTQNFGQLSKVGKFSGNINTSKLKAAYQHLGLDLSVLDDSSTVNGGQKDQNQQQFASYDKENQFIGSQKIGNDSVLKDQSSLSEVEKDNYIKDLRSQLQQVTNKDKESQLIIAELHMEMEKQKRMWEERFTEMKKKIGAQNVHSMQQKPHIREKINQL